LTGIASLHPARWRYVLPRESGVSSTPCSLDLIADVSGILVHPHSRVVTTASLG
jgi:hypothetical protein